MFILPSFKKDGIGNTRLNQEKRFEVHLDYLRIKAKFSGSEYKKKFDCFLHFIGDSWIIQEDKLWSCGPGATNFRNSILSLKFHGGFIEDVEKLSIEVMVDIPGVYWESESLVNQWRFIRGLQNAYGAKCLRVDAAIDDYSYLIPVDKMIQAWRTGNNALFKKYAVSGSGNCLEEFRSTHYFGSRNSGKMLRIYEKEKCIRMESEFKRKHANKVFETIASMQRSDDLSDEEFEKEIAKVLSGLTVGVVDFINKSSKQREGKKANYRDCKRLDWWQEFIDSIGIHLRIRLPKVVSTLKKTVSWVNRQVITTLLVFRKGLGKGAFTIWLEEMSMKHGIRLNRYHDLYVEEIRKNPHLLSVFTFS